MTKLEMLNVFLNDRLTAAAEDIFRAVKDTVLEYQSEIVCAKEENERLKRLLNIAVERLLLRPEPPSVHLQDDGQPCESEERGSVEPLPQIKEEPNFAILQTEDSQEARDSDERNASHVESLQSPQPPPSQTVCSRQSVSPPPTSSRAVKAESDGEDGGKPSDGSPSSTAAHLHGREARSDFCTGTEKSPGPQKTNQRAKSSLSSTGAQNARILQIKNIRSLKPPPPHPSHSSPNIQRWHSCKECGKGFNFACQLEVHMRWHTKEKPYSCTVCRKSFTTVSMLKRHHRIHTGEKPFRCLVCGKCFNQSAHLNTHFRLHAREGQPEPGAALQVNRFSQEEAGPRQAICKL